MKLTLKRIKEIKEAVEAAAKVSTHGPWNDEDMKIKRNLAKLACAAIPKLLVEREEQEIKIKKMRELIRCSFCGKSVKEVFNLVAGDSRVFVQIYICDECLKLSAEIMAKKTKK